MANIAVAVSMYVLCLQLEYRYALRSDVVLIDYRVF